MELVFVDSNQKNAKKILSDYLEQRASAGGFNSWSNQQLCSHVQAGHFWSGLFVDSEVVAMIFYLKMHDILEICYLETHVKHLRKGYMSGLLQNLFRQDPVARVWLDVHQNNQVARDFYLKMGFKSSGLRKGYYRDGSDSLQLYLEA